MKKVISSLSAILFLMLLAACSYSGGKIQLPGAGGASTPTQSPEQMQTQISSLLTSMPTNAGEQAAVGTSTPALPTIMVQTATPGASTAAVEATAVASTVVAATPTPQAGAEVVTATAAPTTAVEASPTATTMVVTTATAGAPAPTVTLVMTATVTPTAGPTSTPAPGDPRTRLGNPSATDPMDKASTWIWPTGSDTYSSSTFENGVQSITALTGTDAWRLANPLGREFTNLYLESTIRTGTCSGSDHYGLMVRVPIVTEPDQGYMFDFTCDGRYSLRRWNAQVGTKGEMKWLVNWTKSSAINAGSNQTNRMGIMTVGSRLLLYANGQLLAEVQDNTFPYGYFGVLVGSDVTDKFTIQIDEMSYWENPQP